MSKTDTDQAVEQALDELVPNPDDARDATPFREIFRAAQAVEDAQTELRAAVARARAAGTSWTVVGAALGVTKQAAAQRFSGTLRAG